ncbi:MAG TPA: magnesium transporter [Candidatus Nanoarchaeia archaeon]|nr:magnesium transporter [Candidatus Nanoarchaeia archaeon]
MKAIKHHLELLRKVSRKSLHPLIHKIHKAHKISKRTLFYIKEYGIHSNVPHTIIKESIKILLLASIISSFGGLAIESIKDKFFSIIPLVILLPALNNLIGDYGIIVSSRFSNMLYEGKVREKWWDTPELKELFGHMIIIALITTIMSSLLAILISQLNYLVTSEVVWKIMFIALIDTIFLVALLFLISVLSGIHYFKKKEDPNNFLIPITTSFADLANMVILTGLILLFF